ncbi:hypothetical protein DAPPUDRAFT_312328 [Daphnia pulex]|uniref:Peptidase C1A papain C-terminal domain-containing protein n=1 Tax=Daphnia pulex TaxID=6669 RepID=E9G0H3_DAPPU|nr:hypothetical protein DAPPUDRAFT_312328 [Daphnia pulex]|eukprot:EFX87400.1 hypothetical protein DAPPUDRAFT_312328 [Daphnia pulex]
MKLLFVFLVIATVVTVIKGYSEDDHWKDFKKKHNKDYRASSDGGKNDKTRKELFRARDKQIKKHNSEKAGTFRKEHNQFSDLWPLELRSYLGVNATAVPSLKFMRSVSVDLQSRAAPPASFDLRYDSCLPAIKNQGQCGSCWSFTSIAPLEFSKCKKAKVTTVLSEQHLVDCDTTNGGCNGGWYVTAWTYLKKAGGSAKQTLYNYTAKKNTCRFTTAMIAAKVSSFGYVQSNNATAMQLALQQYGPLAVAITVVPSFYSYASGVYDDNACDGQAVNHAVVLVGWGNLNGVDYWIVRNSWGTNWGLSGYFFMKRGVNKCGIETYPAFVVPA